MVIVEGSLVDRKLVALYGKAGRVCGVVGVNLPRATRSCRALVAEAAEWDQINDNTLIRQGAS
jgi:3-phenylpropionate/trans-cinnamate dioxygenase ferredoxin reductase subunit